MKLKHAAVRICAEVVSQHVGDELIILNLQTGIYWGLNETGAAIWDQIAHHGDVRKSIRALRGRYDASEEQLTKAVEGLIAQLMKEGLVVNDGGK